MVSLIKLFQAIVLSIVFVKYAGASAFSNPKLGQAIDSEDFEAIKRLCEGHQPLYYEGIDYAIETKPSGFIINFINQTNQSKAYTLAALYRKGSKAVIEEVLKEIDFSQKDLVAAASEHELMCIPGQFTSLFSKITTSKDQEYVIEEGIRWLFINERTDCIVPLLTALDDKSFQSKHLKNIAIQKIFKKGAEYRKEVWTRSFFDHPAITSTVYAIGLITTGRAGIQNTVFHSLLTKADKDDLRAVQRSDNYSSLRSEFRTAIETAIFKANFGGTRLSAPVKRAEIARETIGEIIGTPTPTSARIYDIIGAYVTEYGDMDEEWEFCEPPCLVDGDYVLI